MTGIDDKPSKAVGMTRDPAYHCYLFVLCLPQSTCIP